MSNQIILTAIKDIPMVRRGDDLCGQILQSLANEEIDLKPGDIIVVAQKVVSKAEGRTIDLNDVTPGQDAHSLAKAVEKDPRLVELILSESKSIIRQKTGVLIVEHRQGWIMANAGIDASNVRSEGDEQNVLLLPVDPEKSAEELRAGLMERTCIDVAVVISDSFGRPWRMGTTGIAIGAAGLPSIWDRRGETDLFGNELKVTQQAVGDEVATAASLLQGQASEGLPVVHLRGLDFSSHASAYHRPASDLLRDASEDLFR